MPLSMRKKVFITAAITGSGGTQDKSLHVPRSPEQLLRQRLLRPKRVQLWCIAMCVILKPGLRPVMWPCIVK